ncbi:DUF6599 family protein [Solidesulfovibrio carbinolicus]|uniref:Uncharacterized protein n=1 Tax=Solidesulfovibrio carbinolicus TaxID=296842 RepID=A0A4P6HM02_9BACT|nr:DUF6599 family protein [Solidesulfovibrio carbinolicus]QAZ68035.1 hypothetical protein C3Y92_12680 [Solidesulfovibrio carbinolicus]
MTARRKRVSRRERWTAWGVLTVLAAIVVWLGLAQSRLNPAVLVALSPPPATGVAASQASGRTFADAAWLESLPGAQPAGPVESYDPETLSDRIDGKAELYLAANFQEMSIRAFRLPDGTRLEVAVYTQATPTDAFAVLSSQRRPGASPSPVSPDAYATENALYFTKGNRYVEMTADRAEAATGPALAALALKLAEALPAEAAAKPGQGAARNVKALFPAEGLVPGSVRLAASDAMGMEGFSNVYTAEYDLPSGSATAFLAERDTAEAAAADARAFAGFLKQNGYAAAPPPAGAKLPAGVVALGADGSFEILWTRGRLLAGVHDAVNMEAAVELTARLAASLKDVTP